MSGERLNDSTRHLGAGVYLDPEYRNRLIYEVYLDRTRRVAPSYGFALEPVLFHARRALLGEVVCDLFLVGTVVVGLLLTPTPTVAVLLILMFWRVSRAASQLSHDYVRYYLKGGTLDEYTHLKERLKVLAWVWRAFAVVPLLLLVGLGLHAAGRLTLPNRFDLNHFNDLVPGTVGIIGAQVGAVTILATVQHFSLRALRTGSAAPGAIEGRRIRTVARQQAEPITIFSRFRPFIGSGFEMHTWSFVQRLVEAGVDGREEDREWDTPPFRTADIVRHLEQRISSLAWDQDSETRLSGLTVNHHIFVAGTKTADLPEEMATADPIQVMADPTGHARHYLACQIESWDGEIVTTVYVHASIQGRMLYLEFSTWALPPTRQEFHVVDQPGGVGLIAYGKTVGRAAVSLPSRLGGALPRLATHALRALRLAGHSSADYDSRCRGVDIGSRISARELGAGIDDHNDQATSAAATSTYFQKRDVLRYAQVIERRLLAAVLDFLEDRHVDVAEYRQRMVTILNVGAVNFGSGNVTVTDSAIGQGATVHNN
ncbi:hypothetical protein [Micromonospora sp. DT47]|uniref:hypothetical protein n=1 Tax=Micromonospora sp. DT47 TaxID=3393431 RepID=UPI003CF34F6A